MHIQPTDIRDVKLIEPKVFGDERGFFLESWNAREFAKAGINETFVQDNHSRSVRNVLRGLHYQIKRPQGKLVRVIAGEVYDVAVDLRRASSTFGKWAGVTLSAENKRMLWIPAGFAHGFLVISEHAEVLYKATDYYAPADEKIIAWADTTLDIDWPVDGQPIVSARDAKGAAFTDAETYP